MRRKEIEDQRKSKIEKGKERWKKKKKVKREDTEEEKTSDDDVYMEE